MAGLGVVAHAFGGWLGLFWAFGSVRERERKGDLSSGGELTARHTW